MAHVLRFVVFLGILWGLCLQSYAQCTVFKDKDGLVITTCEVYAGGGRMASTAHQQLTYLGSPYLTFPVWQEGRIRLDESGKEITCELAYDLVTNQVTCRFNGEQTVNNVTPASFIINGVEFIRQANKLLGIDYRMYTTVLYNGQTKLLKSLSKSLVPIQSSNNGYTKDEKFNGVYQTAVKYYIRKGDAKPELINLSKKSLLDVLYDQAERIAPTLPGKQLTTDDVVEVLKYYDSLTVMAPTSTLPLANDAVFKQTLHDQIRYPDWARNQRVYGRVYVGFDVDSSGQVTNITLLSPGNGGFGFEQQVQNALKRLAKMKPDYAGKYALPVAFTYTNSAEKGVTHTPVNVLPPDRLGGRTLLDEYVVPVVVSKIIADSREVWGYYK